MQDDKYNDRERGGNPQDGMHLFKQDVRPEGEAGDKESGLKQDQLRADYALKI